MKIFFSLILIGISMCMMKHIHPRRDGQKSLLLNGKKRLEILTFGSCNNLKYSNVMFPVAANMSSDVWMWTGDIIYADHKKYSLIPLLSVPGSPESVRLQYQRLKEKTDYQKMISNRITIGVWDDHDYNCNNGGKDCFDSNFKAEMANLLFDFLDEPMDSIRRKHGGVYDVYTFGEPPNQVKIFLLDVRSFRDAEAYGAEGHDILGKEQWAWLERELEESQAQLHFFVSGIQILPSDKPFIEKWGNFPSSRKRLFELIERLQLPGVVLFSGDIHFGQILRDDCAFNDGYPVYEVTSSGMTHCCESLYPFGLCSFLESQFVSSRAGDSAPYYRYNIGRVLIDWDHDLISIEIIDENGLVVRNRTLSFSNLSFSSLSQNYQKICKLSDSQPFWVTLTPHDWLYLVLFLIFFAFLIFLFLLLKYFNSHVKIKKN